MNKKQKIWLWIFLAMFILPELLWSPILNIADSVLQNNNNSTIFRPNFLMNLNNTNLLLFVLIIQIVGILGTIVFTIKLKFSKALKVFLLLILLLILIIVILITSLLFSFRHGINI